MRISISSLHVIADDLKECVSHIEDIEIRVPPIKKGAGPFKSLETNVVVAIVSASSAALGALITGLLNVAAQGRSKKIVIERNGTRIEVPVDCPAEKVKEYVELLKELDIVKIEV